MEGQSMKIESYALKDSQIQTLWRKFLYFLPKLEDTVSTCRSLILLLSSTQIGTHRWMSRPKIELTELVKSTKCVFSVSSLQQKWRRAFYQKPPTKRDLMTRSFKQVCSTTTLAMLIDKRSWKSLSDKAMMTMMKRATKRVRFLTSIKSMRCLREALKSMSCSLKWTVRWWREKTEPKGLKRSREWNLNWRIALTSTIVLSRTGKCQSGLKWNQWSKTKM